MARRSSRSSKQDDKYLRLTGLWPSKKNDKLLTGRLQTEQVEQLIEKCQEALDAEAPIVMSLWENDKKGRKDPDFSLQCFVGEPEDEPRSSRGSSSSSRRNRNDKDEDEDNNDNDDNDENADDDNNEDEEDNKKSKKSSRTSKTSRSTKKTSSRDKW